MQDALKQRISLRAYDARPIEPDKLRRLEEAISRCNAEMKKDADHPAYLQLTGPHLEDGTAVHMKNRSIVGPIYHYIAGFATDDPIAREMIGYYGEKVVLLAEQLGLGSCWIAETFDPKTLAQTEREGLDLQIIISLGYAPATIPLKQQGIRTAIRLRTKKPAQIMTVNGAPAALSDVLAWFVRGLDAVLLGPTAINKLPVVFDLSNGAVSASMPDQRHRVQDFDLGISKLHFELGADLAGQWEGVSPENSSGHKQYTMISQIDACRHLRLQALF